MLPHATEYGLTDGPTTPVDGPSVPLTRLGQQNGQEHAAATEMLCGAYLLDQSRPHPLLAELPAFIHLPARIGRHPSLRAAIDLLGAELARPRQGTEAIVPALLDMLLLFILRAWYDEQANHGSATGWAAALADPAISTALRGIHREPERPWTVASLGIHSGLSRAAFAKRFTALLGQPPLAYLTWWRMTVAARLLHENDAPLGTVADRCGYTSEFAFAKAFKREYGIAPGRYRRLGREPENAERSPEGDEPTKLVTQDDIDPTAASQGRPIR